MAAHGKIISIETFFSFGEKVRVGKTVGVFLGAEGKFARFKEGAATAAQIKEWKKTSGKLPGRLVHASEITSI